MVYNSFKPVSKFGESVAINEFLEVLYEIQSI